MSRPLVIGLEGPSYSGKSTLAARLVEMLPGTGCLLPCYVDLVGDAGRVPAPRGTTAQEQLASLRAFIALDRRRSEEACERLAEASWVVADRTWLSLLAHTYAVARTGGPDVYDDARVLLTRERGLLCPSVVLYLAVSEARRRERVPAGHDRNWNADPAFNAELARFFTDEARGALTAPLHDLDGEASPERVAAQAAALVDRQLRVDGGS